MKNKKVAVAMSGGVDSSVTAALLLEKGYQVFGLTMLLSGEKNEKIESVTAKLGIPCYSLDWRKEFAEKVIQYFVAEYLKGRTPNPCVVCNREFKFGALLKEALALGADYLATGHYARSSYSPEKGRYLLFKARDKEKDQAYFLYNLAQKQLAHTLFPLGNLTKSEVQKKAELYNLSGSVQPESQDICFITNRDYREFLRQALGKECFRPGKVLNAQGEVVGEHQGLPFYTIGQRKGLGLNLGYPVYVRALNAAENTLIVGTQKELFQTTLWAAENNLIAFINLKVPLNIEARTRLSAKLARATLFPESDDLWKVVFEEPQWAITPGQSVVYYQGETVLGGGTIEQVGT